MLFFYTSIFLVLFINNKQWEVIFIDNKFLKFVDNIEMFLISHISTISFLMGLILGILSILTLINFSIIHFVIVLILGIMIFELYKKYFASEPDFIAQINTEELENAENEYEYLNSLLDEDENKDK